ncbi:hypothetical protein ACEWY4_026334 [Coilia grayii]|uniref:Pleckstrin homology domain-containing family M member 1 n=1 Tax=Coilia grayii TaxID=363190 RepID=A0ABD1IUT5_9TELE
MLATQSPDTGPDTKDVKQWIKEKIAQTIKALQKRYVATDAAVTSEDGEANLLCCALEAVFIHGIKAKHVRSEAGGGRARKGGGGRGGGALPQPDFWGLLKSVTHRDVILELERLSFISSGVGRCRAWVRLALNDGLLECYLASLLREDSKLAGYYQQGALLLDPEDREVLLSLLQGLASLSFQLSYKSAVLNEWTVTPLALAGLCPPPPSDPSPNPVLPPAGRGPPHHSDTNGKRKESWDTASQSSSGGSDVVGRGGAVTAEAGAEMSSSNLSLDTTGSSQLSSSLSSDSLLQGTELRLPDRDSWEVSHADVKKAFREESTTSSQDSMREDSYISSLTGDQLSESTAFSSLDNDTHTLAPDTHLSSPSHTHTPGPDTHLTSHTNHTHLTTATAVDDHHTHTSAGDTPFTHTPVRDTHTSLDASRGAPLTSTPADVTVPNGTHAHTHLGRTEAAVEVYFTHMRDTETQVTQVSDTHHLQVAQRSTLSDSDAVVEVLRQNRRDRSPMRRNRSPDGTSAKATVTTTATTTLAEDTGTRAATPDGRDGTSDATATNTALNAEKVTRNIQEVTPNVQNTSSGSRAAASHAATEASAAAAAAMTFDPVKATEAPAQPSPSLWCLSEAVVCPRRSGSTVSRQRSADAQNPTSWISEEDIYKPVAEECGSLKEGSGFETAQMNGSLSPPPEPEVPQTPSVVHRRQIGLSNPFRGLLKLGTLERRGAVGIWWQHHCELSPFELRLYLDPEERAACDTSSLLRCEEARLHGDEGRFLLAFGGGKRLHLRAGSRGEAEDWLERIQEAVAQIRPATRLRNAARGVSPDDEWEEIRVPRPHPSAESEASTCASTSSSSATPTSTPASPDHTPVTQAPPPPLVPLDWTRPTDPEPDAIKEAVVYQLAPPPSQGPSLSPCAQPEEALLGWTPLLLSLSLEALRGFRWDTSSSSSSSSSSSDALADEGASAVHKVPMFCYAIQTVRDVVPDTARGGPEFFRVVTSSGATLTLRAENGDEARAWRALIRGALDSYLDTEEEEEVAAIAAAAAAGGAGSAVAGGGAGLAQGSVQRLVQHRLKGEAAALLPHLCIVPTERGLDAQSFRCAGCSKQIGFSMGRARLCEFSAQYYCETCHRGDAIVVPSRMVHNWDLTPREVCRQVLKLLGQIESEPLLNLDLLNPDLYGHAESMALVRRLRQKLRLLGDYVLLCRSGIKKKLQNKLHQRGYLLESEQLYSVLDLRQIAEGQYQPFLLSLVQLTASHVHACSLCTQRGFICQICNADDIIFPFQFETTSRCKGCKSVFHASCRADSSTCPRCVRLQRYLERDLQD